MPTLFIGMHKKKDWVELMFQLYLTTLEVILQAAETLNSRIIQYWAMLSRGGDSRGRVYLPEPPQLGIKDAQNIVKTSTVSEQCSGAKPARHQEMDAIPHQNKRLGDDSVSKALLNLRRHTLISDPGSTDCYGSEKTDTNPGEGFDKVPINGDTYHTAAAGAPSQHSVSGMSANKPTQYDWTAVHMRGGFYSAVKSLSFSKTSRNSYSGAFFQALLTMCINRIEYPEGEVTKFGAGESYRPSAHVRPRSPPGDNFRSDRDRSPRRDRPRSPPISDSYHPGDRRRSRTPPYRRDRSPPRDSMNWRPRARSPRPRSPRRFSPRRDDDRRDRARSPRRDDR